MNARSADHIGQIVMTVALQCLVFSKIKDPMEKSECIENLVLRARSEILRVISENYDGNTTNSNSNGNIVSQFRVVEEYSNATTH